MAISEVYVDPAIAANSGTGTIGDPYGDLQYALNTEARDTTNGDRFNVKAGTSEFLSAAITLTTYGTPTATAPLVFQGYTSAAGDGGVGVLDGGGSVSILSETKNFIYAKDLRCTNVGNRVVWKTTGSYCAAENCQFDGTTGSSGNGCELTSGNSSILNCHFTNLAGIAAQAQNVGWCTFKNSTNDFITAIVIGNAGTAWGNLISIDGASIGIKYDYGSVVHGNAIWSNGGTGSGILYNGSGRYYADIINNLVEGFSGGGGIGIGANGASWPMRIIGKNRVYNCTTNYSFGSVEIRLPIETNTAGSASLFVNAAADDFTPAVAMQAIAYPTTFKGITTANYRDLGGVQHQDAGGGSAGPRFGQHGNGPSFSGRLAV